MTKFFILMTCLLVGLVAFADQFSEPEEEEEKCVYKSSVKLARAHSGRRVSCKSNFGTVKSQIGPLRSCEYNGKMLEINLGNIGTVQIKSMKENRYKKGSNFKYKLDIVTKENRAFSCYY
jgi:hypothetical protein